MKIRNLRKLKYEHFISNLLIENIDRLETDLKGIGVETSLVEINLFFKRMDIYLTFNKVLALNYREFGICFNEDEIDIRYIGEDVSLNLSQLEEIENVITVLKNIFGNYDKNVLREIKQNYTN